jgi:CBS domain-containing protein
MRPGGGERLNPSMLEPLVRRIANAAGYDQLAEIRHGMEGHLTETLLGLLPAEGSGTLNFIYDQFAVQTAKIAERELMQGLGSPPVPYAFVMMGSGGRSERTSWSDQDHGLLYGDPPEEASEGAAVYFRRLGQRIYEGLLAIGFAPCEGGVVCSSPQWSMPLSGWRATLFKWMGEPSWEHMRYLLIAADMRPVYGDFQLAEQFKSDWMSYACGHPALLRAMLRNTLHRKASLGVFGQIIRERYGEDAGGVDIKYGAYLPIVNGVRLLAIQAGIMQAGTIERIKELSRLGRVPEELAADWLYAFSLALKLRFRIPHYLENGVYRSRGFLPDREIAGERKLELKYVLHAGKDLHLYVRKQIGS